MAKLPLTVVLAVSLAAFPYRAEASPAPKKPAGSSQRKDPSRREQLEKLLFGMANKIQHGKYKEAVGDGKKASSIGKDKELTPLILVNTAVAQMNLGNLEDAKKTLAACEREYGPNPFLLMNRGLVSLRLKENDAAERSFLAYIEGSGGRQADPLQLGDAYYYLGEIYMLKGMPDAAYGFYFEAAKQNPGNAEAWLGVGDTSFQARKWEIAANAYGRLETLNGFQELSPQTHFRYGTSLLRTRNLDGAERHLVEYAKREHLDAAGRYNLACVHSLKNEPEKAMSQLRMAFDLGFSDPVVKDDPDLQAIRGSREFGDLLRRLRTD